MGGSRNNAGGSLVQRGPLILKWLSMLESVKQEN